MLMLLLVTFATATVALLGLVVILIWGLRRQASHIRVCRGETERLGLEWVPSSELAKELLSRHDYGLMFLVQLRRPLPDGSSETHTVTWLPQDAERRRWMYEAIEHEVLERRNRKQGG